VPYRILLINLFLLLFRFGYPQQKLPVLASDSTSVSIKIDGNRVAVWNVLPETKPWNEPDEFKLERSLSEQRVTYVSNRDSLSFVVRPGGKYDFIILIANQGAFPMRVTTFDKPIFQQKGALGIILFGMFLVIGVFYRKRAALKTIPLLYLGIITPLLFWATTLAGGWIHGDYNHLHDVVSELGAIGTRSELFMTTAELLISVLSVFAFIGLYRACRELGLSSFPVFSMLGLSLSMAWAATFPMHHVLHGTLGPLPIIVILGAGCGMVAWRGKMYRNLRWACFYGFVIMLLILLRIDPSLRGKWEGLIQRLYYVGWSIWSIMLSLIGIHLLRKKNKPA
jgi:hypothetical protein